MLTWHVGPDRVDATALAQACTTSAGGAYTLEVEQLPRTVDERHDSLVRRMVAHDDAIDLLSLDSSFTAEFAAAGFLAPVPPDSAAELGQGIAPAARDAATYDGRLVAAPWFLDPQLLWFRGNVAERAGLDTTKPISWDDLIAGAQRLGVTVQIEDRDGSALAEWVNALVAGSGGQVVSGTDRSARVGLDTGAGRSAASIVELFGASEIGPGPSTDALQAFAGPNGGFLIGSTSITSDPALVSVISDLGWAPYPVAGDTSVAPLAGVALAVPADAPRPALSYKAISCLTSESSLQSLLATSGHSPSRLDAFDDPSVRTTFPMADVARAAVKSGTPVPSTPYWHRVATALDVSWLPLADVSPDGTPPESQAQVRAAVAGRLR
ncbi:MAG: hypothetical protein JWP31_799 [Aeromicrobium sp.]|nr:hypothetical protein [Aeromicrobium sp.]